MGELSMREAYGRALADYGEKDAKIVVVDVDTSSSTLTHFFARRFPERFFNTGIAEPCMVDVGAGLALGGLTPFVNGFAALLALRALEQIRTCVCYARTNVKIAASYAGVSDYKDGPTHHAITDLANMRALPGMTVICPADSDEAAAWVPIVAEYDGPVYLRISRGATIPVPQLRNLVIGEAIMLRPGNDMTILATGSMVGRSSLAVDELLIQGISARLVEVHTIKPLDVDTICQSASETGAVVTAEEHSIIGGLGGAVAEALADTCPVPLVRVGIHDRFCRTGMDVESVMDASGLSVSDVVKAVVQVLKNKEKQGK